MSQQNNNSDENLASEQRKGAMLTNHVTYERQCLWCKIGTGLVFSGLGAFNVVRTYSVWKYMKLHDKLFNAVAISFIFGLSGYSFLKGYQIHIGQQMDLVEFRPSFTQRFRDSYSILNMKNLTPE